MKNLIKIFEIVTAAAVISFSLVSCSSDKGAPQKFPPARVTVYTVKPEKAFYHDSYPATVTALNQVEIRPEVSGYLTNIYFQDGQYVTKGMKLYGIDQQQYKAAYDIAKANLDRANQDYERYQELAKNNAIAKQTLEHAFTDLQAAESNLSEVETNLRNSIIYAPFDGTIGISQVKLGSAVTVGQTLMNTISSDNPMAVDFPVNEDKIVHFENLLNKKKDSRDSTFTIRLPDQSIYSNYGKLVLLDRAVDPNTGTLTARLVFPNLKNLLKPGMTCNVRVLNNVSPNDIIIPFKAVTEQMGEYFVFVIQNGKAIQKRIEIGINIGDKVIVKNGLSLGSQIVIEGVQKLRDNSPVVVVATVNNSTNQTAQR